MSMYNDRYGNVILCLLSAIGGAIALFACTQRYHTFGIIKKIGKNSLYFYSAHMLLVKVLQKAIELIFHLAGISLKDNFWMGAIAILLFIVSNIVILLMFLKPYKKCFDWMVKKLV